MTIISYLVAVASKYSKGLLSGFFILQSLYQYISVSGLTDFIVISKSPVFFTSSKSSLNNALSAISKVPSPIQLL